MIRVLVNAVLVHAKVFSLKMSTADAFTVTFGQLAEKRNDSSEIMYHF